MQQSEVEEIKRGLALLTELVAEINEKLKPLPTTLKLPRAAKEMDVSAKKLRQLVKAGEIAVKKEGRLYYVPLSEVRRWNDGARRLKSSARRGGGRPRVTSAPLSKAELSRLLRSKR